MKRLLGSTMPKASHGYVTLCVLVMAIGALAAALYAWRLVSMASDVHQRHLRTAQLESVVYTLTVLAAQGVQQEFDRSWSMTEQTKAVPIDLNTCLAAWCPLQWGIQGKANIVRCDGSQQHLLVRLTLTDRVGTCLEGRCLVRKEGSDCGTKIIFEGLCTGAAA